MKKQITKKELLEAIRKKLQEITIPEEIIIDNCNTIIDTEKFFELHIRMVEILQVPQFNKLYANRLKEALKVLNIDVQQLAKEIQDAQID